MSRYVTVDTLTSWQLDMETKIDTASLWDGESSIASLDAYNGVTKCRGIIFCASSPMPCCISSFSCKESMLNYVDWLILN